MKQMEDRYVPVGESINANSAYGWALWHVMTSLHVSFNGDKVCELVH